MDPSTVNALVGIWSDILDRPVAAHQSFLEVGGDSLSALRVTWRIAEVFHVTIPFVIFFEPATLTEMAALINRLPRDGASTHAPTDSPPDGFRP